MMELIHKSIHLVPGDIVMIANRSWKHPFNASISYSKNHIESKKILRVIKADRQKDYMNILGIIMYEESNSEDLFLELMSKIGIGKQYVFRFFYRGKGLEKAYKISKEEYLIEVV